MKRVENGEIEKNPSYEIETDVAILAIGHSARDTFYMLNEKNIHMERKIFSVGVRIEHKQAMINHSQYGKFADKLPTAEYKLNAKASNGRGVYTFCMCPGGVVVPAASEIGRLVVNGMSYSKRDLENSNSAVLVNVFPEDFDGEDVMAGVEFQRRLEESEVLNAEAQPIAGLYAIGNVSGSMFSGTYPHNENCLSHSRCVTFGYNVAKTLAAL